MKIPNVLKRRALSFVSAGLGILLFASAIVHAENPQGWPESDANCQQRNTHREVSRIFMTSIYRRSE